MLRKRRIGTINIWNLLVPRDGAVQGLEVPAHHRHRSCCPDWEALIKLLLMILQLPWMPRCPSARGREG